MLTECPSCLTVFRVTPAILKMGHGQVRCGKCRKQFDAIECMLEGEEDESASPAPTQSQPSAPIANQPPQPVASEESSSDIDASQEMEFDASQFAEEVTMEGSRIEISGTYRVPSDDPTSQEKIIRERVVIDRGDSPPMSSRRGSDRDDEPIGEIIAEEAGEAELDPNSDDGEPVAEAADHLLDEISNPHEAQYSENSEAPALPKRWRRSLHPDGHPHQEIHAELHALTQNDRPRVLKTGVWATICAVFAITLLAQVIHHNRDALVRDPNFGNTVTRLYRVLGLNPNPNWDLSAYQWDIYKVGLDPKLPDALRVVGSVANNASFAQPYPLGKLSLKDRWESPVGVRAFEPYEYLPSPEAADRLMAPKQRTNIEIVIADPGPDAVGYLIHACLEQDKKLACADEFATQR
jgi:predicted Zn finger-like uncharacterized protein